MFIYQFEIKNEITNCYGCPAFNDDYNECNISRDVRFSSRKIPENCPLIKVTADKEGSQ